MKKILLLVMITTSLSACGGSSGGNSAYAVPSCKPTDNFECVPEEENGLLPDEITKEIDYGETNGVYFILGNAIKTGEIVYVENNTVGDIKIEALLVSNSVTKGAKLGAKLIDDELIPPGETYEYKLPKEAVGKYVSFGLTKAEDDGKSNESVTIRVE